MRHAGCFIAPLVALLVAGCATTPSVAPPPSAAPPLHTETPPPAVPPAAPTEQAAAPIVVPSPSGSGVVELLPGVRVNRAERWIEFDGTIAIDAHDPKTPNVYLELMVCTPDTKEHETLVVTRVKPSDVHAALLAIGLTPGVPGRFIQRERLLERVPATGDPVIVTVHWNDRATRQVAPITDWVVSVDGSKRFGSGASSGFVFAGSRIATRQGRSRYDADGMGTLVGLTTFGAETIAWQDAISPDSWLDEPSWIADRARIPTRGTPVAVRIAPAVPTE